MSKDPIPKNRSLIKLKQALDLKYGTELTISMLIEKI